MRNEGYPSGFEHGARRAAGLKASQTAADLQGLASHHSHLLGSQRMVPAKEDIWGMATVWRKKTC